MRYNKNFKANETLGSFEPCQGVQQVALQLKAIRNDKLKDDARHL